MITSFLESHPGIGAIFGGLGWLLTLVLELWIGERRPLDATSSLKLLWTVLQQVLQHFQKQRGTKIMASTNTNARVMSVTVDGPTFDALGAVIETVQKFEAGEKPQQIAAEEIGHAMLLATQVPQIQADISLDRTSVENAVALQMVSFVDMIMANRSAKPTK